MNHLFYGESTALSFSRFNRSPGTVIFHEAMATGPAVLPSETLHHVRAQYLAGAFDASYESCLDKWRLFDSEITSLRSEDELVCWFGNDFFCQIAFIYVLVELGQTSNRNLSLVSPGAIDDGFYCFADLPPAEMNDRLQKRVPIAAIDLQHAAIAWHLYADPDPRCLNAVFDGSIDLGQRFARVLELHANRFPRARGKLGITERSILHGLRAGPLLFSELFLDVSQKTRDYTWGDTQIRNLCWRLVMSEPALIEVTDLEDGPASRSALTTAHLALTDSGRALLNGELSEYSTEKYWLGGCEMTENSPWCWDPSARRIETQQLLP